MASNAIANYLKNLGQSMKYAATEVIKEQMPVSGEFVATNQEVFKDAYKTIQDIRIGMPRLSTIQNNVLYKSVAKGLNNIKSDVMSGKFYHPEREDPMASMGSLQTIMGALGGMGDEFNELMAILGGDFSGMDDGGGEEAEQHPEYKMITKGDALVSATLIRTNMQSTNAIGRVMTRLSENRTKTTKAIADMQMMQSARSMAVQQHGFDNMARGFNAIIDFNNQIMRVHVENSTKFYQTMTDITRDTNATLHAIHDIQETLRNAQAPDVKEFKDQINWKEMFKGGLNLKSYTSMVKDNIKKSPMYATYTMIMGLPMMLEQFVANPMHTIAKSGISALMGAQLQVAMQRIDKTLAGAFSTAAAKLFDYGKQNSNTFLGKVAQIFGLKQKDHKLATADASKYQKGNMSWNGIAQKSLVEVIPGHLRRIEAALTGQGERLMNFETGKWTSAVALQKYERNLDNELTRDALKPISKQMKAIAGSNNYASPQQRRQMSKAIDDMMKGIYARGYVDFEDINLNKNGKYGNEGLVQLLAGILRSMPTHEVAGVTNRIADAKQAKGQMISASGGLENYGPANEIINGGLNDQIRKRSNLYQNTPNGNFGLPNLTELADSRGYTLYDYQNMILEELRAIRTLGSGGKNRGGGRPPGGGGGSTPPSGGSDGDEPPPAPPNQFRSDPADKARRQENAFEDYQNKLRRQGLGVVEGFGTIDLDTIMKNPNSKEAKDMMAQMLYFASENRRNKDDLELSANSSFLSGAFRSDDKGDSSNIIDQLLKAGSIGEKFDVVQKNIGALLKSPATLLAGVISKADAAVYDILFGKDVGEKDENGKPILGIFHKMTNEVDKVMEGLNDTINDMGKKIKDFFTGKDGIWGSIKKGLKFAGIDIDAEMDSLKSSARRYTDRAIKGTKKIGKDIGADTHNAVAETMADMGFVNQEGKVSFNTVFENLKEFIDPGEQVQTNARGTKRVQSAGLTFISPGEAIIPANMNPWNPNRNNVDIKSQQKNEERLRNQFSSKFKNAFAQLGEAIPTNAGGTTNTAAQYIVQQLNRSGLSAAEVNSVILAKNQAERNAAIDKIIESHKGNFEIKQQLSNLETFLTSNKFARGATTLRASNGVKQGEDGKLVLGDITSAGMNRATHVDTVADYNYTALAKIRGFANQQGYTMDSDEQIGQKKFAVREGPTTGIRQGMLQAFGTDPVKAAELSKNFIMKNSFSLAKGGAIGALLSAVFPLGGPLMGSLIGAGVQTLSKSEKFQDYMFGKVVKDDKGNESRQGGLISKSVMDTFAKYAPDMKKYGITGAIGGLITPFGPLGGAMIGAGASIIKNNKRVNDFFFGDSVGLLNKDRKAAIKKAFPNMGAAMLGTFFLGPFGLLGNAVLGAGIGLVSTTETFKKIMLGAKGRDGIRRGGIAGAIRRQITDPFKRTMTKMGDDIAKWFRDDIVKPVGRGIVPIGKLMGGMVQRGTNNLFDFISRTFRKKGTGIARIFDKALYGVRQAGGLGKWIGKNTVGRIGSGIAGLVGKAGDAAERYAILHGYGNMYSAKERLDFYNRNNITGTAQVASDVAMNKMSDDELTQNSQMLSMLNAHLNGDVEREIDKQRRKEAGLFENDLMKIGEGLTDQNESDALDKLRDKLHSGLMKGKYDAVNADEAAKLIASSRINEDTKRKVLAAFNKGHANMMDAEARFKVAKDKSYLHDNLSTVRKNFNLGDISDEETIKLVKSLSRNAENEVSVRKYGDKPSNAISEEAAKAGAEGELSDTQRESIDLTKKQTDIQEKTKTLTEMMLEKLTSINDTLMGKNVDKTSESHGAMIDAIEYMRRQNALTSDRFGKAYGEAQDKNEKRRAESDAELGLVEGGALEGQSADARNTLVDAFDRTYRNNKLSDLAGYFKKLEESRKALGHDGKIAKGGLEEIIKLTQEKGVKKTRRILALTMYGYKIPIEHYKTIVNLTDTGYMAIKNVAKAGGKLDKIDSFADIMDDPAGRAAAQQYAMIAEIQKAGDGSAAYNKISNMLAGQLTSEDYVRLMEDEDLRDKRLMGATYQDLYTEDQSKFAGSAAESNVPQGLSSSMNGNVSPFDAEKSIKGGKSGAIGRFKNHVVNNVARVGSGVADTIKSVVPGTTYLRQGIANIGDRAFAGYIPQAGTQLTTIAAGITGAMPRNAAEQYMNNLYGFYDSSAGQFYHGVAEDNRKFTYDKFNKLSEEKQREYVLTHSQDELNALIATAPEDAKGYLLNRISEYKASAIPTHAWGTKLAGLTAIGGSLASIAGGFGKDTGKSFLGGMFGLDKDGNKLGEEKKSPEEVAQEQMPQAQMGPQVDSNAIAAIGKAVSGDNASAGGVTKNEDGTMIVPAGDGQFLEYAKSRNDGDYMVTQTKNNVEVENRRKHKDELQERSVAALEGMAGTLGVKLAGAGGQMAKKTGGGLLDMIKGLAEAPFKLLDSLPIIGQLGLGAMMLGGVKGVGGFLGRKATGFAGGLLSKIPGVAGLRESLGGKIAQGGLSGGILNKLFGKFALAPGTTAATGQAAEQMALDFGEQSAAKSGGGFLSKAGSLLGKLGTKGKIAAGVLGGAGALFGGYKLFGGDDDDLVRYGPHEEQVTTKGQLRDKGFSDEEINILQTYAMHGAPTELALEAIYTRRQQAENQHAGTDHRKQSDYGPRATGWGSTLAGIGANIAGYKLGSRFTKNYKWLGGSIGGALGGAAVQYATTGEMPGFTDIAMDAGTGALLNWGAGKIGNKLFNKGGAQAAEQTAINLGDDAVKAAAKNPGFIESIKTALSGKLGPEAMQKARVLLPKLGTTGKVAALLGAGYLGSNYLLGDHGTANAAGLEGYSQEDLRRMSPEQVQAIYSAQQNQGLANTKGQGGGIGNLIGSLGGMAAGSFIGKRLLKKHPLIGTILGATAGETLGNSLTGGETSAGDIASNLATNSVLYNIGNIYRYGKDKLLGGSKTPTSTAPVQGELDFGEETKKTNKANKVKSITDDLKDFTNNGVSKATNAIQDTKSIANQTNLKGVAEGAEDISAKAAPYLEKISSGFKKVFDGVKTFIPEKAVPSVGKFFEKLMEHIAKPANVAKAMAKMAKQSTAFAVGATTFGIGYLALTVGFAVVDFYRGYNNADEMLKLKPGTSTDGMKFAAGLVTAITGAIPFIGIFLPEDFMLELAIEYLGPAFGFTTKDLEKARSGEVDPHSTESFGERITEGFKKTGHAISEVGKTLYDITPVGMATNFASRAKAAITGENYIKDSGRYVSDREAEQNKSIILGKLKSGAQEIFAAIQEWIPTEVFDSKDGLIEQMIKQSDNPSAIKKAMTAVGNKINSITDLVGMGTSTVLINMPIDIEEAKKAFIDGSNNAGFILDIEPSSLTNGMKSLAGIVAALCNGIPFLTSLIKEDDMVKLAMDNIGPSLGIDRSNMEELRRKGYSKTQRAKDMAAKVTNIFKDKAKEIAEGIRSGVSNTIDSIKQFGSNVYNTAKDTVSKTWNSVKQTASDVYDKGAEIAGGVWDTISSPFKTAANKMQGRMDTISGKGKYGMGGNFYSQLDPAFAMAYNAGSDSIHQTMSDSGCGPVSAVNALSAMGMDVDPRVAAKYALDNGYKEQDGGTIPTFFRDFMGKAGVDAQNVSGTQITDSLKSGKPVVLMGKDGRGSNPNNPFAENPHYVTATGMDNNGNIIVQDPESYTPNQVYKASDVIGKSSIAIAANRYGTGRMGRIPQYGRSKSRYGRGTDNAEFIWNWLIKQGFSNQAAAGIMGNMQQECSFNPHAYQGGQDSPEAPPPQGEGEAGYGLCQWTGSRTQRLIDYARSKGQSSGDLQTQLEYMMIEARESGVIDRMNAAQTPEEAATIWGKDFERCGEMGDRIRYATEAFQKQGKGITNLSTVSGGPGGQNAPKKNGGLMGKLGEVMEILDNALTPWAKSNNSNSSGGPGSTSSSANIRRASDWARSVEGHPGHGNNGCTQFVQDYLNQANHPFAKTMSLYVPTLMEQAKEQNMWKESNPSEGDIAVLETNDNREDGPDHVVIYDGKGGCWGNSSGQNKFLHYGNMLDAFPGGAWGYVNTGDGSSSGNPQSSGNPRDEKEVLRDSSLDYGVGKHARFGMGGYTNIEGLDIPDYNRINPDDPLPVQKAKYQKQLELQKQQGGSLVSQISNIADTTPSIPSIYDSYYGIPEYNRISDDDNLMVQRAKRRAWRRYGRAKGVPNSVYSPKLGFRDKKSKFGRGGMMDDILGMAQKVAAPVSKMMSAFGEKFKSILGKSSLMPFITKIFGDDNPFLAALGMSSPSSGSSGTNTQQSGPGSTGSIALPQEGSVGQKMMAGLPDASIPNNGYYGDERPNHIYGHGGIDYNSSDDTAPIPTPVDGTVEDVGFESGGYGNYVQIQDAAGNYHMFAHLSSQSVKEGDKVTAGQIVGNMGSTGASTGPHLHYQVDPPENGGAETNKPHIDPNGYMPPSSGAGKHFKYGRGNKPRVSKWGRGGWQADLANANNLKSTPKPVGESFKFDPSFGVSKFEQKYARYGMGEFNNIEGLDIPEYNRITDDDSMAVRQAKYQKQLELQKQQRSEVSAPTTPILSSIQQQPEPTPTSTNSIISFNQSQDQYVPEYNRISDDDSLMVQRAKLAKQQQQSDIGSISSNISMVPKISSNSITTTTNQISSVGDIPDISSFIPSYNRINDDDSLMVREAKLKKQRRMRKDLAMTQAFEHMLESAKLYSMYGKGTQTFENIEGIDIPEYNRITDDDSLDVRQAKYQQQLLIQREQSLKDASKEADKAAELQDSLVNNTNDTVVKEPVVDDTVQTSNSVPLQSADNTTGIPSDSKIAELIEGQNKTNQLLAAILSIANAFVENMQSGSSKATSDDMQLNSNTRTKENSLTTNIKAVLSSLGGGSNVGMGDKLIPSKNDPTNGINQIMNALNMVANR